VEQEEVDVVEAELVEADVERSKGHVGAYLASKLSARASTCCASSARTSSTA
jgi:hypothetical protein